MKFQKGNKMAKKWFEVMCFDGKTLERHIFANRDEALKYARMIYNTWKHEVRVCSFQAGNSRLTRCIYLSPNWC